MKISIGCIIGISLTLLLTIGCVKQDANSYKIISTTDYDHNSCMDISFLYKLNGFNTGLGLTIKDQNTGKPLTGHAEVNEGEGSTFFDLTENASYTCEESTDSGTATISVFSEGYTPVTFKFNLPKNKSVVLEIPMRRSCTGGQSYLDSVQNGLFLPEEANGNQTESNEIMNNQKTWFFNEIKTIFGLDTSDYNLDCNEADIGRGGFIKATGSYNNTHKFELFYGWEPCSSGGSGCGWKVCFKSNSEALFQSIKSNLCNRIYSDPRGECSEGVCRTISGTTSEAIKDCLNGKYEQNQGDFKIIAINQHASHEFWTEPGNFDCIGN